MPTKILLADDSMTAQKMGKDILTAAGYEVTAVSNGAAASKKLADKFDLIILDVYMPGYSGLEVCEKIRSTMDIAKTPVLLTVGKMEHFEPADTQRVKADGVIIKPFEATDLLAIVQKLEQKAAASSAPPKKEQPEYEKTMIFTAPQIQEFKDQSYAEWKTEASDHVDPVEALPAPAFEMSSAEASAPAFAMDMPDHTPAATSMDDTVRYAKPVIDIGSAPVSTSPAFDETVTVPPSVSAFDETIGFPPSAAPAMDFGMGTPAAPAAAFEAAAAAPAFAMPDSAAPAFDLSASSAPAFETSSAPAGFDLAAPAEANSIESLMAQASAPAMPGFEMPAEPSPLSMTPTVPLPSLEPTVMPGIQVSASADPYLETPPAEEVKAYSIPVQDPALASRVEMSSDEFVTKIGVPESEVEADPAIDEAAELAAAAAELAAASATEVAGEPAPVPVQVEDDFEARVAAAMSGFSDAEPAEAVQAEPEVVETAMPSEPTLEAPVPVEAELEPSPDIVDEPAPYEDTQKLEAVPEDLPVPVEAAESMGVPISESQAPPEGMQDASLVEQMQAAFADLPVETAPHVVEEPVAIPEAAPEIVSMSAPAPVLTATNIPPSGAPDMELASALAAAVGAEPPPPAIPAIAAAAEASPTATGMDPHTIAQVVNRVMERMLPAVMIEIAKELEQAKK